MSLNPPRRARWAVPAAAVAVVAGVAAGSAVSIAQAAPALPPRTAAQLLADAAGHAAPPALTGTVVESADLGIPQLPGIADPTSIFSLLSGSHTLHVWYSSHHQLRLSMPVQMGESDLIVSGHTAWLWQSQGNQVTKYVPAAGAREPRQMPTPAHEITPQQAARQALAAVGPSTKVSTEANVDVAGQAAYQLVLQPRTPSSLIGKVTIAMDAEHPGVPLRVQVFAKGAASPSIQIGYTSISFVEPSPANFTFSPPPGAHVQTRTLGGHDGAGLQSGMGHDAPQVVGKDWLSVAVLPSDALTGITGGSGSAAAAAGQSARAVSGQGGSVSASAILGIVLKSAHPVHGSWGSGRLLHTSLLNVLITSNGKMLVGAVTPAVLYAAAAHAG